MYQISVNIQAIARRFALPFIILAAALLFVEFSHSERNRLPAGLQDALTDQALAFLRNEYSILITGDSPVEGLVSRLSGMSRLEMSGEDRIVALQKGRENSLQHGKHYSSIDVDLTSVSIEKHDGIVVLHAVENVVERFTFDQPISPAVPDIYEESTHHDFLFSVSSLSVSAPGKPYTARISGLEYTLTKDITEPQLLNVSNGEEKEDREYSRPPAIPLEETPTADKRPKRKQP